MNVTRIAVLGVALVAGVGAFFRERERPEYMIGAQVHYQSLDIGDFIDGWGLTGFGEYYLPNITLGGAIGYSSFKRMGFDIDGWNFAAQGSYYVDPDVALRLNYQRANSDFNGYDLNDWSLNGEVEYQIPDCTTAIYVGLGYGGWDDYGNDYDSWRFGLGLRFRLGEIAPLIERNRDEPTQLITLVRPHLVY